MSYISESPARTLLTPREVAFLFNVSPQTVYLWYGMGKIEGVKIGPVAPSGYMPAPWRK